MKTKLFTLFLVLVLSTKIFALQTYTVSEAISAYDAGILQEGDSCQVIGSISKWLPVTSFSKYHNINYYITDGINELQMYNSFSLNNAQYAVYNYTSDTLAVCVDENGINLHLGDTIVGIGKIKKYDSVYELYRGCYIKELHPVSEDTSVISGTCGDNLTWELNREGILNIYGSGDMSDYSSTTSIPWYTYRFLIKVVNFPDSITSIGSFAFADCSGLTSVTIPNSVTSIGGFAFSGCSGLTSVTIPNSVTSIGNYAFLYVPNVVYSGSATGSPWGAKSVNGYIDGYLVYSDEAKTTLLGCSSTAKGAITIPNSVTNIEQSAFRECSNITTVIIPNSVTSIGDYTFADCTGLTSIEIPNSIESLGSNAFRACSNLTSVEIPNSVTSIGNGAFYQCGSLASVSISNSVTSIKNNTFAYCRSLTSVTIPSSIVSIEYWAFDHCINLISVTVEAVTPPALIVSPGVAGVFDDCSKLSSIFIPCGTIDLYTESSWPNALIKYSPLPYTITVNATNGNVSIPQNICELPVLTATPNYGYHFAQWSDGNKDNPRTIELTQDTTFTAEFAKNSYAISTISANPDWGTTAGDTTALYLDEVEISAIPNYGYYFVRWNDYNTSNPRIVSVTEGKTYTATFAKNIYSITKNAEHGTISGNSSAEYLDFVTLTVTPDYGYHFTQWSDGLKDNPRIAQITKDTAFTAEFAPDRVGTCGKDLALVWSYDPTNKVLTIGNAGSFTENMEFGVEAPNEMEELVIGNSVTAIGANAFAGIETLKKVSIGESVKTIGEQAFYNCVNLETIFNYRPTPTNTYSNAFDGVDKFECVLYVLPSSIDMYKNAAVWRDFYYTYAIGAEETTVTTNDVQVEPQDNAATLTWPTNDNAASYTIQITKDGVVFCTLIFNANGQLIGIAFAPGRDREAHAPAALMTANGLQFTVTGLDSGTQYGYNVTAKDANDQTVATYSGEFTTTSEGIATGIDNIDFSSLQGGDRGRLILHNGQIFILRGEKVYTVTGQEVR